MKKVLLKMFIFYIAIFVVQMFAIYDKTKNVSANKAISTKDHRVLMDCGAKIVAHRLSCQYLVSNDRILTNYESRSTVCVSGYCVNQSALRRGFKQTLGYSDEQFDSWLLTLIQK